LRFAAYQASIRTAEINDLRRIVSSAKANYVFAGNAVDGLRALGVNG